MAYGKNYTEVTTEHQLNDVVLTQGLTSTLNQFLKEYEHQELLKSYGLSVNNKLLFYGPSGCGKTYTAEGLASELNRKLIVADLSTIVSARLGQTAQNISSVFQKARIGKAVLFLDEFDSLGTERTGNSKESGEMRRVVNTILQLIDNMDKDVLLIAATNQLTLLDFALVRRFEHKVEFKLPDNELLDNYYRQLLAKFPGRFRKIEHRYGISFGEARVVVLNQIKNLIIAEAETDKKPLNNAIRT